MLHVSQATERIMREEHLSVTFYDAKFLKFHTWDEFPTDEGAELIIGNLPTRMNYGRLIMRLAEQGSIKELKISLGISGRYPSVAVLVMSDFNANHRVISDIDNTELLNTKCVTCYTCKETKSLMVILYVPEDCSEKVNGALTQYLFGKFRIRNLEEGVEETLVCIQIDFTTEVAANVSYERLSWPRMRIFEKRISVKFLETSPEFL